MSLYLWFKPVAKGHSVEHKCLLCTRGRDDNRLRVPVAWPKYVRSVVGSPALRIDLSGGVGKVGRWRLFAASDSLGNIMAQVESGIGCWSRQGWG